MPLPQLPSPVLVVALTGNIASGKSTVARRLSERGATVIDADQLSREVVAPGTPALREIVARWGTGMLQPDGALDRAALRQIVFASSAEREALNAIVHPRVAERRVALLSEARARGAPIVVCDIPLLYETASEGDFDGVILVHASADIRRARLMHDRGLSRDEADRMIAAQLPSEEKRARADYVVDNEGSREALATQVDVLWETLRKRAQSREAFS